MRGTRCARRSATSAATLPPNVQGPFFNDEFGDVYGVMFAFSTDGFNYRELKDYVEGVRQQLLRVPQRLQGRSVRRPGREDLHRDLASQARPDRARHPHSLPRRSVPRTRSRVPACWCCRPTTCRCASAAQFRSIEDLRQLPIRGKLADLSSWRHCDDHARLTPTRRATRCARGLPEHDGREVIGAGRVDGQGRRHHRARQGRWPRRSDASRLHCRSASTWRRWPTSRARSRLRSMSSCDVLVEALVIVLGVSLPESRTAYAARCASTSGPGLVVLASRSRWCWRSLCSACGCWASTCTRSRWVR